MVQSLRADAHTHSFHLKWLGFEAINKPLNRDASQKRWKKSGGNSHVADCIFPFRDFCPDLIIFWGCLNTEKKMTGETPEVRSDKRKLREKKEKKREKKREKR